MSKDNNSNKEELKNTKIKVEKNVTDQNKNEETKEPKTELQKETNLGKNIQEQKKEDKKKKYALIALLIFLLLGIAVGVVLLVRPTFEVKKSVVDGLYVEYGEKIPTSYKKYINVEEDVVNGETFKMTIHAENEEGKDYPAVGHYDVEFNIEFGIFSKTSFVQVTVQDTTKPKIKGAKDIVVSYGSGADYLEGITVTDLSEFELSVDATDVDLLTPGEYNLIYTAIDIYGNKRVKEVTVTVVASGGTSGTNGSTSYGRFITYVWSEELQQWIEVSISDELLSQIPENVHFTSFSDIIAETEMLTLINNDRLRQNYEPLMYDLDLYILAKERAVMLGSILSQTDDIESATYKTTVEGADGEVVGYASNHEAAYVYNMFMNSKPHKENLQRKEFTKAGVNQVIVDDVAYWIVLFGY